MKCEELLSVLNGYIDGTVDSSLCREFEQHLASCKPCQVVIDTTRKTILLYKLGIQYELPKNFQERLHGALRQRWKGRQPPRRRIMKPIILGTLLMFSILPYLTGCSKRPTKEEFFAREAKCLQCYCTSNAPAVEADLLDFERFAVRCQSEDVQGILYDEVFARLYGRLYLVERHLNRSPAAEKYLEKYADYHAISRNLGHDLEEQPGDMERLIAQKYDDGLKPVWRDQ